MTECVEGRWLLLIHQIPPKPGYLRVKIWRRLQGLGAVAIKNSVYVIPRTDQTLEDFHWVLEEIVHAGAEASICTASFVEGLTDNQVEALFHEARDADYAQIADEAHGALDAAPSSSVMTDEEHANSVAVLNRLKKRFTALVNLDFFGAPGREKAAALMRELEERLEVAGKRFAGGKEDREKPGLDQLLGRTWVTRKGVYVDRIGCAWLIRRFIDPAARFRFVSERGYRPRRGEMRFDMFEGEFTHEGGLCTFEVLVNRFFSTDQALLRLSKVVHDIDLKEQKSPRPEAAGMSALLDGMTSMNKSDEDRLERGSILFDNLYEYFRRK
jgi:hypothetical protein